MKITVFGADVIVLDGTWNIRVYPYVVYFNKQIMLYEKDGDRFPMQSKRSVVLNLSKEKVDIKNGYRNIVIYLDIDNNEIKHFGAPITRADKGVINETYVELSKYYEFYKKNVVILADIRVPYGAAKLDEAMVNYDRRGAILTSANGIPIYKSLDSEINDNLAQLYDVGALLQEYSEGSLNVERLDGSFSVYPKKKGASNIVFKPRATGDDFVFRYRGFNDNPIATGLVVYSKDIDDPENYSGLYINIGDGTSSDWKLIQSTDGCPYTCEIDCETPAQLCCETCFDSTWASMHDDSPEDPCYQDCSETCTDIPCGNCEVSEQVHHDKCQQIRKPIRLQKCELDSNGNYKANNAYDTMDFSWDDLFSKKDGRWVVDKCPNGWDIHNTDAVGFTRSYILWSFHHPCKNQWVGWEEKDRGITDSSRWISCNDFKMEDVGTIKCTRFEEYTKRAPMLYAAIATISKDSNFVNKDTFSVSVKPNAKYLKIYKQNGVVKYQKVDREYKFTIYNGVKKMIDKAVRPSANVIESNIQAFTGANWNQLTFSFEVIGSLVEGNTKYVFSAAPEIIVKLCIGGRCSATIKCVATGASFGDVNIGPGGGHDTDNDNTGDNRKIIIEK